MDDATKNVWFETFSDLGEDLVRRRVETGQYTGARLALANQWLAKFDQEARERSEASSSDSLRIARSAKNAAWLAAISAIVAIIISVISLYLSASAPR